MAEEISYILNRLAICPLFSEFSHQELVALLPLMEPRIVFYEKDARIFSYGEPVCAGLILEGALVASQEIYGESAHIVEMLESGDLFCVDAVFSGEETSPTDLTAEHPSRLLFFELKAILQSGPPEVRECLSRSINRLLADRCIRLLYKTEVLSVKSLRSQIMTFFYLMQRKHRSDTFNIKMNRQQLAQYLCVNRSALSRELNRMQRDGLIRLGRSRRVTVMDRRQLPADTAAERERIKEYPSIGKTDE